MFPPCPECSKTLPWIDGKPDPAARTTRRFGQLPLSLGYPFKTVLRKRFSDLSQAIWSCYSAQPAHNTQAGPPASRIFGNTGTAHSSSRCAHALHGVDSLKKRTGCPAPHGKTALCAGRTPGQHTPGKRGSRRVLLPPVGAEADKEGLKKGAALLQGAPCTGPTARKGCKNARSGRGPRCPCPHRQRGQDPRACLSGYQSNASGMTQASSSTAMTRFSTRACCRKKRCSTAPASAQHTVPALPMAVNATMPVTSARMESS